MRRSLLSLMAVLAICAGAANATLIAQWDFDGDLTDSVGSYDGTCPGTAVYTTGANGQALLTNGSYTAHSIIPTDSEFASSSFMMEMDLYVQAGEAGNLHCAVGNRYQVGTALRGLMLYIYNGKWDFRVGDGIVAASTNLVAADASDAVVAERWTHIKMGYDAEIGEMFLDVDGSYYSKSATYAATDRDMFIGAQTAATNYTLTSGYYGWKGAIDNVRYYNAIPEPATIALLSMGSLVAIRRKK